jgi:hypothetical protein
MIHRNRNILTISLLLATMGTVAHAQEPSQIGKDGYRVGLPGVITPPAPPKPPPPPKLTPFEAAYQAAGHPRLVLFFNHEIADTAYSNPVLQRKDTLTASDNQSEQADTTKTGSRTSSEEVHGEVTTEWKVNRDAVGSRHAPVDEASQWMFESAFTEKLSGERIRLVDRATAMRIVGREAIIDPQQLETAAIRNLADIAVIVRAAPIENGGLLYRITAVDTRNGRIVGDVLVPTSDVAQGGPTAVGTLAGDRLIQHLINEWTPAR